MSTSDDGAHPGRARVSCDLCRRMKIRCDREGGKGGKGGKDGKCSNCLARGTQCKVTRAEMRKPKGGKQDQFRSIESRIYRMESLIQSSGIIVNSPPLKHETSSAEAMEEQSTSSDIHELSNLIISDAGAQKYTGASSIFALLSPRGLAWVQRKTGSDRINGILQRLRSQSRMWGVFRNSGLWVGCNFAKHLLPPKDIANRLVDQYFTTFNATFPLFDRKLFSSYLDRYYANDLPQNKQWYGALNIVLSIGCITATESMGLGTGTDGPASRECFVELADKFFQNAFSVFTDLLFADQDLMAVQTVIGMALFMQAAMNPDASFVLVGIAVRMGHSLGLHRWLEGFGLSQSELEQRRRVFWIIYILEKGISIRIGRPSTINDADISVPLPPEDMNDDGVVGVLVASNPGRRFYPFRASCAIALIQSRVYNELYSARAWMKTAAERLDRVSHFDQELQEWKDKIPLELRPEHTIQCDREQRFAILMLHFVYYNCAICIHRVSVHHGGWIATDDEAEIEPSPSRSSPPVSSHGFSNPRVYASYALCLSAARSTIHLATQFLDVRDDPLTRLIWVAVYFPITACFTLFAHTLQSPFDPRVENDLKLMERTLSYVSLSQLMGPKSPTGLTLDVFGDLVTVGREYVNKVRSRSLNADAAPHESRSGFFAPEPPSVQGSSLANIESSDVHPSRPFYSATPSSSVSALLPANLTMDDAMANAAPSNEFSYAFNFVPFDMTDPDPSFQFAFEGNQYPSDLPNMMGDDAEFMGVDDLKAGQASYIRYQ